MDIKEIIERNWILLLIIFLFWLKGERINEFLINQADTISITFIYLFLFSITDILFKKIYFKIKEPVKKIIDDSANLLKAIPKIEYFITFSIAVGIITWLNYLLFPWLSSLIKGNSNPWIVVLVLFVFLYLLIMNWFFPRFYKSLIQEISPRN